MVDRTLTVDISLEIHQPGINPRFHHEREVVVPPDYTEADFPPFLRHELERTVTELEVAELGEARAAKIIAAYELRIRVIEYLLRTAPHPVRTAAVVARIREVMDADNDDLFAAWRDRFPTEPED